VEYRLRHLESFPREGANLILTYQGDRQKDTVEELAEELGASRTLSCDVTQEADMRHLSEILLAEGDKLDAVVHSIAFANREDLCPPVLGDLARGLSAGPRGQLLLAGGRCPAVAPAMVDGGSIMTLSYLGSQRVITTTT